MLEKNLTRKDLREITGFSGRRIKNTLKALVDVNAPLFYEMCKILDVRMEDFLLKKPNNN